MKKPPYLCSRNQTTNTPKGKKKTSLTIKLQSNMARINWTRHCNEFAKASGIELFKVTYRKNGEIKTCMSSKGLIEAFKRLGVDIISINQ